MALEKKNFTDEHKRILKRHELQPHCWELKQDLPGSLIIKHRITGEFKVIDKKK